MKDLQNLWKISLFSEINLLCLIKITFLFFSSFTVFSLLKSYCNDSRKIASDTEAENYNSFNKASKVF